MPRLAAGRGTDELLLDDAAGVTLAALIGDHELDVGWWLNFAVDLSGIIAAIHRRGVVHRGINPVCPPAQSTRRATSGTW